MILAKKLLKVQDFVIFLPVLRGYTYRQLIRCVPKSVSAVRFNDFANGLVSVIFFLSLTVSIPLLMDTNAYLLWMVSQGLVPK